MSVKWTQSCITEIINELTFVKDSIREDDCTKLIDAIQQSQRVFLWPGACRLFHESLHHAPDAYGQRGLRPDETITPNFGPGDLFIVSSASGETAQLVALAKHVSLALWRVNPRIDTPLSPSLSTLIVQINAPSKNQKILFSALDSRWRRCMALLLVIADA